MRTSLKVAIPPFNAAKVGAELQHEVEQFYYREAALVDHCEFEKWLSLMAEDIRYYMPLRSNRNLRNAKNEFFQDNEFANFDDDITFLRGRVRKLLSDFSWSENPASHTRHFVTNVMITVTDIPGTYEVNSALLTYRNRCERQVDIWSGERRDVIRRADNEYGFQIAKRTILLDQTTILASNLSIFF